MKKLSAGFEDLEKGVEGERVAVGFRPSGELHVGNLLTIAYAAVLADKLGLELDLMCCDTDWSAHIHEHHRPENNRVMKLFFERSCGCDQHRNVAHHRVDEISDFLKGVASETVEVDPKFLSEESSSEYREALRSILENMSEFDEIFGGGFRRRYRSPVTNVCDSCGFSHAKGAAFSEESDEVVASCRNSECEEGFASSSLDGDIGVYYLVDPVRDPSRNVAVHVFGGDYRDAEKGQKTSKVEKVSRITELATGETPEYFLAPLISDSDGKPLSKSKNTGRTVSDIDDLEEFGRELCRKAREWIREEKDYVPQEKL